MLPKQIRLISRIQPVLKPVLIVVSYLIGLLFISSNSTVSAWLSNSLWLPLSGLNFTLLLLGGWRRYAPLVFIGVLITLGKEPSSFSPILIGLSLTIVFCYSVAATVLRHTLKNDFQLQSPHNLLKFTLVTAIITLVVTTVTLTVSGSVYRFDSQTFFHLWLSQVISLLTFTPFIVYYVAFIQKLTGRAGQSKRVLNFPLQKISLDILGQIVFIPLVFYIVFVLRGSTYFPLLYLFFLPLIWFTLRHGLFGASITILAVNFGILIFVPNIMLEPDNLLDLQLFMLVLALTGLFLGSLVAQHRQIMAELSLYDRAMAAGQNEIAQQKQAEEALKASEVRFQQVISSISDHIYVVQRNKKGHYVNSYFSPHIEDLTGYPRQKFEADWNFWRSSVIHPDDQAAAAIQADQLDKGQDSEMEYRLVRADGSVIWVRDSGRAERVGETTFIYGVVSDVTERKALEEIWRRYEFIVNTSKEFMTLINVETIYEAINEAYCDALNLGWAEIIGKSVADVWGQDRYNEHIKPHLNRCLAGEEVHYQEWFKMATLGLRYFDITYYPYRTKLGEITHAVVVFRDITKSQQAEKALHQNVQKLKVAYEHATAYAQELHEEITEREHIEEALRQSEERIRSIVDNVVDSIITVDPNNIIETVNLAAERIFGYVSEEMIGQDFGMLVASDELHNESSLYLPHWFQDHNMELGQSCEIIGHRKDGTTFSADLAVSRFYLGEQDMFIGILRDITERKHLERQLRQAQKMEAIGQLAGGVAHDFNNILTVISGHTELLLRLHADSRDPQREEIELIKKATDRATNLTRQLLAFSRQQTLRPQVLNLNTVVSNFKEMLPRLLGENIILRIELAPDVGYTKADLGQIEQVLMNLALNARDAMPRGGEILIKTENIDLEETHYIQDDVKIAPGSYVMLTVTDGGIGMDSKTQSRVFDPFFTTKEQGKGTGLGLSMVYGIVRQSDGYIWVDSELGRGTTFKICLPRIAQDVPTTWLPSIPYMSGKGKNGTETVLLVEDESSVRLITRRFLQKQNYVVLEASHPEEALNLCRRYEGKIDLLITDLIMPYMNGHDLAEQLSELYPDLKVLYISGYADDILNEQGVLEPGIVFLEKPFSSEALTHKVREALEATLR